MRILNWVQSKISGRNESKRCDAKLRGTTPYSVPDRKEEFSDWPQGLLAIGTFGNGNIKGDQQNGVPEKRFPPQEFPDFTVDEVTKLQKELTKLLSLKPQPISNGSESEEKNLPLDKFLNCPSSLEVDRKNLCDLSEDLEKKEGDDLSPSSRIILSRAKDVLLTENHSVLKQRSLSFLLKKMFAYRSSFSPMPSLRDPLPESRMEKLLRAILHKKIHPQNSSAPKSTANKYLRDNKSADEKHIEEKKQKSAEEECKWVKTDSEYIVLEI